jgi:hypothetical protein
MREQVYLTVIEQFKESLVDARRVARRTGREIPDPVVTAWWEGDTFYLQLTSKEKHNGITFYFNEEHSDGWNAMTSALLEWY